MDWSNTIEWLYNDKEAHSVTDLSKGIPIESVRRSVVGRDLEQVGLLVSFRIHVSVTE